MRPWCAMGEGEMPGRVKLILKRGEKSCISRHSDKEPMFGGFGGPKLIVSVSFGCDATFRWVRNSDRDGSSGWSQRLSQGDVLVTDGKAQDQFEHWTKAGAQGERINLTYRWIKLHNPGCVSATTGVFLCCMPSCAEGLSVHRTPGGLWVGSFPLLCLVIALFLIGVGCPVTPCAPGGVVAAGPLVGRTMGHYLRRALNGADQDRAKRKKTLVFFASGHPSRGGMRLFSGSHEPVMVGPFHSAMM